MKRLIFFLSTLILFCLSCNQHGDTEQMNAPGREGKTEHHFESQKPLSRKEQFEQIRLQKIAFITQELDLTTEESQQFWPVYNEWWKTSTDLRERQFELYKSINKKDNASIEDAKELVSLLEEQALITNQWVDKFSKVLPANKVAKVFVVEERFKNSLIRKGPNWKK